MQEIIGEICSYILDNLYNDITLEKMEETFYYSRYHLIRMFKDYTGFTIKEFINTVKVLKTIDPLLFSNDTILKIALCGGFNSQEYYSEKFQNIIGISPLKFRNTYKDIDKIKDVNELKLRKQFLIKIKQYQYELLNIANYKIDKKDKVLKLKNR